MIRLFTTYYHEPRPDRCAELDICIALNALAFDGVYILAENIRGHVPRGEWVMSEKRQKYIDILQWASSLAQPDDVTVIANCDIVIPAPSAKQIMEHLGADEAYCLSRYEVGPSGRCRLLNTGWSQDVWAFRGPSRIVGGDYFFGVPGCDNRLAHEMDASGYKVLNPSKTIKTFHIHSTGQRTATNSVAHRVDPPYLLVDPSHVGDNTPRYKRIERVSEIYA